MHIEASKMPMETVKDLAKHYLMIVLGILTALALEGWVEHVHEHREARASSARIEAEIQTNRQEIDKARTRDLERMHDLEKLRDTIVKDINAHATDAEIVQHVQQLEPDGIYLDWRWPGLQHEAWDVAVANQSASWMDSDTLHRYATVYAAQNASTTMMNNDLPLVLNGPRMFDMNADLRIGTAQPVELLHVVNQMAALVNESTHNLDNLAKRIDAAMSSHDSAATSTSASR